jgi:TPR repeat protein
MRISRLTAFVLIGTSAAGSAFAQADPALLGPRAVLVPLPGAAQPVPLAPFSSARDALRTGVQNYNAGNKAGAAQALEFAAGQGHALALWKLGRMYSAGDGVPHDALKAFEYFSKVADEFADETPGTQNAKVVSSAFVALGAYFRDGIPNTYVKPNPARAAEMFQYAASYYGDPEAQYHLSRLFLEGAGVPKDARQAGRWANLSAEKGLVEAQALLGQMMINGVGMPRQGARGLMWLTLARDGADQARHVDVVDAHKRAFDAASQDERDAAMILLQRHLSRQR